MQKVVTRTQAIKSFLEQSTHEDLAALYTHDMECQVNVAQDGGTSTEGEYRGRTWHGYTDGQTTWKPFRIPRNANTNPEYTDVRMGFDLIHAEGIGMTGWDWKKRLSRWVAYDFDAIMGHADRHSKKISDSELDEIRTLASGIEWVTLRRSASGQGLHLYVFFDPPVITQNHNEHAALARAVLGQMSALAKYDFSSTVDICGHNMWVWHRKMKGTNGLCLIHKGIPLDHVPPNWKDHVKVVAGHVKRNLPSIFRDLETSDSQVNDAESFFAELTGQAVRIQLDDEHRQFIKWLEETKSQSWWDSDHHMLITHTYYLKKAHEELQLRGIFQTDSSGTEAPNDHNCFMFPLKRGAWTVRRYSMGCKEASTWDQDGQGWTRCYYNCDPTLPITARSHGGIESSTGAFVFTEAENAVHTARNLGAHVPELPVGLQTQRGSVKPHRDGRILIEIEGDVNRVAADQMNGWLHEKGKWRRLFNIANKTPVEVTDSQNFDETVRHVITETGTDYGWMLRSDDGQWRSEPLAHIAASLEAMDNKAKDIKTILGSQVMKCWKLVNRPFQPEYPGNREWNKDAAQMRFIPSENHDNLKFPHWTKVLDHCGSGLDEAVQNHPWARVNGLKTGADYLKVWITSLFKHPTEPLPYLFFHSKTQDNGKSIFHEALSLLVTRGYQRADVALINQQGFNEELKDAIVCVVEELNLNKNKDANNRIKDWVTARQIPIHPKGRKPYHVINTTHWIQTANEAAFCPVFPGDTRITMIHVPDLDDAVKIPKRQLIAALEKEAPDFLAEIMLLEIPPSNDRLNVPMIATAAKRESENMNRSPLEIFLDEHCYEIPGSMISFGDFFRRFEETTEASDLAYWTKIRVGRELPTRFPKGRDPKNGEHYIGNISFNQDVLPGPRLKSQLRGKLTFLVTENGNHDKGNP